MLIRPHDAPIDTEREWRDLVAAHPFGHLIATGAGREFPVVVPTHVHFDGDRTIRLHLARPNPVWAALRENQRCLFVVTTAVAYVPTSWEAPPGTPPEWGIPTSHYASVHLECTAAITDEPNDIRRYLADQLATMQPDTPFGDPLDPAIPYTAELRQIRGLQLAITDVQAKFKFDGAEPDAVRRQVVLGYEQRDAPGDREARSHLLRRHPPHDQAATATVPGVRIDVVRVNVSGPRPLGPPGSQVISSIAKERVVAARLSLTELNLEGDDQSGRDVHGGVDKAVYAYPSEHLAGWAADLDQPDLPDTTTAPFGENISTYGATEDDVCIGDVWRWGTAVLQVAQPRWPCQKLTLHRETAAVGEMMRSTGRTGWYLRVLEPGVVDVAGPIEVVERHSAAITVRAANDAMLDRSLTDRSKVEALAVLDGVLADEWRLPLVERLAR